MQAYSGVAIWEPQQKLPGRVVDEAFHWNSVLGKCCVWLLYNHRLKYERNRNAVAVE